MKLFCIAAGLFFASYTPTTKAHDNDIVLVQQVVQSAYVDGFANLSDIPAFEKGFHPVFEMLWLKGNEVVKTPIAQWQQSVKKRVATTGATTKVLFSGKFVQVDVTGVVAVVKLELSEAGKLSYTDYLSLYKFAEGWRIVSKVGHSHS